MGCSPACGRGAGRFVWTRRKDWPTPRSGSATATLISRAAQICRFEASATQASAVCRMPWNGWAWSIAMPRSKPGATSWCRRWPASIRPKPTSAPLPALSRICWLVTQACNACHRSSASSSMAVALCRLPVNARISRSRRWARRRPPGWPSDSTRPPAPTGLAARPSTKRQTWLPPSQGSSSALRRNSVDCAISATDLTGDFAQSCARASVPSAFRRSCRGG